MAPTPLVSSFDGPRVTVDDYIKDPLRIPALVLDMTKNEFIVDSVLRNAGNTPAGAVRFEESVPLYADGEPEFRAEFGEVPVVPTSVGKPNVAFSHERAMAVMVSDEMRRRMVVDPVNRQLTQVKNTMIRSWNQAFFTLVLSNPNVQTMDIVDAGGAAQPWDSAALDADTSAGKIRSDIANAQFMVDEATVLTGRQETPLGFEADTMIINHTTRLTLLKSKDFEKPYLGNIADENLLYTGKLPNKILNLDVLVSRQMPLGKAIIMQRNRCGFIADELAMQATPLYRDEPRKTWRSDIQRAAAMGLDQPKSIVVLNGVDTVPAP